MGDTALREGLGELYFYVISTTNQDGGCVNKRTLYALKKSIEHWEDNVAGINPSVKDTDCSLCAMFLDDDCRRCPVAVKTKDTHCEKTPYWSAVTALSQGGGNSKRFKDAARKELKFLKSLLP